MASGLKNHPKMKELSGSNQATTQVLSLSPLVRDNDNAVEVEGVPALDLRNNIAVQDNFRAVGANQCAAMETMAQGGPEDISSEEEIRSIREWVSFLTILSGILFVLTSFPSIEGLP